jgi:hypothetical protein
MRMPVSTAVRHSTDTLTEIVQDSSCVRGGVGIIQVDIEIPKWCHTCGGTFVNVEKWLGITRALCLADKQKRFWRLKAQLILAREARQPECKTVPRTGTKLRLRNPPHLPP